MIKDLFISQQPILDKKGNIFGYELFSRPYKNKLTIEEYTEATFEVIKSLLSNPNNDLKGFPLFINTYMADFDENILKILSAFSDRLIFEIDFKEPNFNGKIKEFKNYNFKVAVDNFKVENFSEISDILKEIDFVKINSQLVNNQNIKSAINKLKNYPLKIIVDKVEEREDFERFKNLNVDYFQGYFFAKPKIKEEKSITPVKYKILMLLEKILKEEDINEIESFIKTEPEIYLKLLQYLNSAFLSLKSKISSFKMAFAYLGYEGLKNWIIILLYLKDFSEIPNKNPLIKTSINRGIFMEKLAQKLDRNLSEDAYLTGLLSLLYIPLNYNIEMFIKNLNLPKNISEALLNREGTLGKLLNLIEAIEKKDLEEIDRLTNKLNLNLEDILDVIINEVVSV